MGSPCGSTRDDLPNREDAASLSETRFLLDATNSLLENRRDLGGRCLCVGVGAGLYRAGAEGCGCGISCLRSQTQVSRNSELLLILSTGSASLQKLPKLFRILKNMMKSSIEL
jgi:hypothetical protein